MASGQADWTRSVAVTVFSPPNNIVVNVENTAAPINVAFPETQNVASIPKGIAGRTAAFEDASFVTGDSPATHDVNTALGRNGVDGYIVCDGEGQIKIEISNDGSTYGGQHTLKKNDILNLQHLDVDSIRVTWVTDSAYRIMAV